MSMSKPINNKKDGDQLEVDAQRTGPSQHLPEFPALTKSQHRPGELDDEKVDHTDKLHTKHQSKQRQQAKEQQHHNKPKQLLGGDHDINQFTAPQSHQQEPLSQQQPQQSTNISAIQQRSIEQEAELQHKLEVQNERKRLEEQDKENDHSLLGEAKEAGAIIANRASITGHAIAESTAPARDAIVTAAKLTGDSIVHMAHQFAAVTGLVEPNYCEEHHCDHKELSHDDGSSEQPKEHEQQQ